MNKIRYVCLKLKPLRDLIKASVSHWFGNEYFRIFPNISESELDLLIPNIPNISEHFRI